MTADGYTKLQNELNNLVNKQRPKIIEAIAEARSHGDLSENAEYQYAKEQQSLIEGKISELELSWLFSWFLVHGLFFGSTRTCCCGMIGYPSMLHCYFYYFLWFG